MYNDNNPNPLEGHNPDSIPVVAARKPVLTMDALNWIKSNPKEKEEVKEKEKTFFEQLQATMMQFEMERLLAQMQQQRLQQPSNQVAKFKLGGTTGGTSVEEVKKVKAIQAKLKAAGFYNGKVDGAWGPKTQEAYTAFEDASNAGCEGEDCNDPFSEGPGSTQAHNGMYNNPPDVNKGAGVIAEMLTGAGLPDNVSFMLTHLLTGNSVVPTGDTQGYGYPNQRTQLELYRAIQNNEKAGKTKPSKTGKRGISYEDYSADIAKKALNNSELDVLTLLGGSLLSDKFNAATTYGQVSYDRDPKDPHIIRVYDNYDFNGKRDAREGENLYRKVRRGVGNTSAILNKESINKAQYIGSYDTRVWDKISEVGIDPHAPMPTNILPRVNSTEYPKFAYGGEVIEVDSLTPAERKWYLENGYDIEEDGVMEYGKGGPVDGYMLPEVEIKAKRRVGSSTVSLTPSDQPTNSEFKKKDNVKENLKWLAMLTADTATDQIPNSEHVKMAYDGYKGNPITGLMNYAKIPAPIILDMLINMMQNNPTGIDTEHLDGYFKGQFEDKSLSNKVSNQYAKGGKVQSYKGGGKINPDEVVTFGEYKNVPFGMLSPEAQQEYKDSKSREIATGVKTEKSSSTRTDIKAGSTEHNVHVSAFPNPDKPLKEHGNPKTTKALRTLSGVDKNELQKSLAVDDLDLLYTLEQEFANNPAYNYSWYHKSKDIWPSAHVPTKQDTVNYNAMLGAVNDYGSKDYHVNDSSYTPTTGDVIRSILGYPAVEHSNGMSIQDMSMLPAELAHRYQQNNGLLNTQRFLTDVVTKGGLGMNYRALYDDATSFEGEAHSLIEPVLKEEFSVRQAREKLRLDGAKIVPTSDEDLVEQSRKTIQKVLSQYAKGGSVQQYPGGSKVYDDKTSQMLIVDKDNMQIFNTKGEQLDWQDFEDRNWAQNGTYKEFINKKRKELQANGITSEYAERYREGESEQARAMIDYSTNYDFPVMGNFGVKAATDDVLSKSARYYESRQQDRTDVPLLWSLGIPIPQGHEGNQGVWDVSEYRPTRGGEGHPYYFTPLDHGSQSRVSKKAHPKVNEDLAVQTLLAKVLADYKGANNKSTLFTDTGLGHLGGFGASVAPDSSYVSFHDMWDLDPNAIRLGEVLPNFAKDYVYAEALTKMGVPKKLHKEYIAKFKEGKSITEILGFGKGVPVYDRIYKDPITGKSVKQLLKERNTYKYGGEVIEERDSLTDEELQDYLNQGYDVEVDGVMHYAKGGGVKKFRGGGNAGRYQAANVDMPIEGASEQQVKKAINLQAPPDSIKTPDKPLPPSLQKDVEETKKFMFDYINAMKLSSDTVDVGRGNEYKLPSSIDDEARANMVKTKFGGTKDELRLEEESFLEELGVKYNVDPISLYVDDDSSLKVLSSEDKKKLKELSKKTSEALKYDYFLEEIEPKEYRNKFYTDAVKKYLVANLYADVPIIHSLRPWSRNSRYESGETGSELNLDGTITPLGMRLDTPPNTDGLTATHEFAHKTGADRLNFPPTNFLPGVDSLGLDDQRYVKDPPENYARKLTALRYLDNLGLKADTKGLKHLKEANQDTIPYLANQIFQIFGHTPETYKYLQDSTILNKKYGGKVKTKQNGKNKNY